MAQIEVTPVAPEVIAHVGGVPVTTAFASSLVVTALVLLLVVLVRTRLSVIPGRLQVAAEAVVSMFYERLVDAYGGSEKKARRYLPLIVGLFVFVLFCNYFTLIPFTQSVVLGEVDLFRPPTSHLSLPLTMALIVFLVSNVIGFSMAPLKYVGNFIKIGELFKVRKPADLAKAFLDIFLGVLDIIGELAKVVSLSCRLFGNIFAGEVMVAVIAGLSAYTQFLVPAPFYALGLLSGLIQALVFSMLALSFVSGMHMTMQSAKDEAKGRYEKASDEAVSEGATASIKL